MIELSQTAPTRPFTRVAIANRGEIACRIIDTLKQRGMRSILLCSPADNTSRAAQMADAVSPLPSNTLAQSYLSPDALIAAAQRLGAEAIHPGYGFLSENAAFAQAVIDAGLVWIGPAPQTIALMGDKQAAKQFAAEQGVPGVPGTFVDEAGTLSQTVTEAIGTIGFPVLIKAAFGGGGRGMRKVTEQSQLSDQITQASREAAAAFGNGTVFVEKCLEHARHIEVQILSDAHGQHIALGERDCSLQRRHQKVVEECPAASLDDSLRQQLHAAARQLAQACHYQGAGTVEFLVSPEGNFYFLEMNTRLQVEHPVTEAVFNIDLVASQLDIAQGNPLPETAHTLKPSGHSIEVRWYAEDPTQGFLPQSGELVAASGLGELAHGRCDHQLCPPQCITPFYDPLLAKIIATGPDRATALSRLDAQLAQIKSFGLQTNLGFLRQLLRQPDVRTNALHTQWLAQHLDDILPAVYPVATQLCIAAGLSFFDDHCQPSGTSSATVLKGFSPHWVGQFGYYAFTLDDTRTLARVHKKAGGSDWVALSMTLETPEETPEEKRSDSATASSPSTVMIRAFSADQALVTLNNDDETAEAPQLIAYQRTPSAIFFTTEAHHYTINHSTFEAQAHNHAPSDEVRAPCHAVVKALFVAAGGVVKAGEPVLAIEAMKIEHVLTSPRDGVVATLTMTPGQAVSAGDCLLTLEPVTETKPEKLP